MAFEQYTDEELEEMIRTARAKTLQPIGMMGREDVEALASPSVQVPRSRSMLDSLESAVVAPPSPEGGMFDFLPTPAKAAISSIVDEVSSRIRGVTVYTPEDTMLDQVFRSVSEMVGGIIPESWQKEVSEAQAVKSVEDLKDAEFWINAVSGQAGVYTLSALDRAIGGTIGGLVSAPSVATGPGAAVAIPAGVTVGSSIAATAGLALGEAGRFMAEAELAGFDRTVAEDSVRAAALVAGAIEHVQTLGAIGPMKRAGGKIHKAFKGTVGQAIDKAAPKFGRGPLLWALKELGINASEGAEEIGQGAVMNRAWKSASAKMKAKYGDEWEPYYPVGGTSPLLEGLVGAGVAAITRGAGYATTVVTVPTRVYIEQKRLHKIIGSDLVKKIRNGTASFEEIAGKLTSEPEARLEPYGFEGKQKRKASPLTDSQKLQLIDMFAETDGGKAELRTLAKNMGIDPSRRRKYAPDPLQDQDVVEAIKQNRLPPSELAYALGYVIRGDADLIQQIKDKRDKADEMLKKMVEDPNMTPDVFNPVSNNVQFYNEALSIAEASMADIKARKERLQTKREVEKTLKPAAKASGIDLKKILAVKKTATPKSFKDLLAEMKGNLNLVSEGPVVKDGKVVYMPPTITKPSDSDIEWVSRLENAARKIWGTRVAKDVQAERVMADSKLTDEEKKKTPKKQAAKELQQEVIRRMNVEMHDLRKLSMEDAGLAPVIAEDEAINPKDEHRKVKSTQTKRLTSMTQQQLLSYGLALQANSRRAIRDMLGKRALIEFDAAVYTTFKPGDVTGPDGKAVSTEDASNFPPFVPLLSRFRPFLPHMMSIQNKTGLPIMRFYRTMMTQLRRKAIVDNQIWIARSESYKQIRGRLIRGRRRRLLEDIVQAMMIGGTKHYELFNKEVGMPEGATVDDYIDRYMREADFTAVRDKTSGTVTREEVIEAAKRLSDNYRGFYQWFFRETGMDWTRYLDKYLPLVRKFKSQDRDLSFGEWLRIQHTKGSLDEDITINDIEKFVEMGDTTAYAQDNGYKFVKNTPFYEFARAMDETLLTEQAKVETSLSRQMDIYQAKLTRNLFFGPLVPFIDAMTQQLSRGLLDENIDPSEIKTLIGDFTESILGIPGQMESSLKKANLTSSRWFLGNAMLHGIRWWNKAYGGTWRELPEVYTVDEVIHGMMTYFYSTTLGIGPQRAMFGLLSPIKNIATQSVMASVIGMPTYIKGLARLSDPKVREYLESLQLRLEFPLVEEFDMSARGAMRHMAEAFLHVFKYSDHVNIMTAASSALVAWERVDALLADHPNGEGLTVDDISMALFEGRDPAKMGVKEEALVDAEKIPMKDWEYTRKKGFRGLSQEVFDMLQHGETDQAKKFFIQTMSSLSQWQYGKGGSPAFLRPSLIRFMFMYSTWWMNYGEFAAWVGTPGNGLMLRGLAMYLGQWALMAILCGLGLDAWRWFGFSPFPEELGFTGPGVQLLNAALRAVKGTAEVGQAVTTPGVSESDIQDAKGRAKRRFSDLTDQLDIFNLLD